MEPLGSMERDHKINSNHKVSHIRYKEGSGKILRS